VSCSSCQVMVINGVRCHEYGCREAWRDEIRDCKWCGSEFEPQEWWTQFCDGACHAAYDGVSIEDEAI
jgi:hypothetical protein